MRADRTQSLKAEIARYSARIVHRGLAVGPGGNTSVRDGHLMWISPSGYALDDIAESSWVPVTIATGESPAESPRPSSEVSMHLAIYRERQDVDAIVHTHPPHTIGIVASGYDDIPFLFPDHVAIVGKLPCIEYVPPCTRELAEAVIDAMRAPAVNGLLMRNHGLITIGKTVKEAYYRTEVVEDAARVYWIARSVGTPRVLSALEAEEILGMEAERYRQRLLREPAIP
jgi:L-fuculose-phosphate aldolase